MWLSILALVIAILALAVTLASSSVQQHFSSNESCRRGIDQEGNERDYWSFSAYRANTLIGHTIGRLCNAFASWRFYKRHKDMAPLVSKKN